MEGKSLDTVKRFVSRFEPAAGIAAVAAGDDRFIGNIFTAPTSPGEPYDQSNSHFGAATFGTAGYDGFPAPIEEYLAAMDQSTGDHERFHGRPMPVYAERNAYFNGARPFEKEKFAFTSTTEPTSFTVREDGENLFLGYEVPQKAESFTSETVCGSQLPKARFPDADFEDPDGNPARMDIDLIGQRKAQNSPYPVGPLSTLVMGQPGTVQIW